MESFNQQSLRAVSSVSARVHPLEQCTHEETVFAACRWQFEERLSDFNGNIASFEGASLFGCNVVGLYS